MPHYPKPFFKPKRNTWYVEVDRIQHPLGKHPDGLPAPKKRGGQWEAPRVILDAYHAKMTELQQQAAEETPVVSDAPPAVATVLDEFVGWLKGRVQEGSKARRTLAWYTDYLNSFLAYLRTLEPGQPPVPTITADQLQPLHVYRWVDAHPDWKSGKRGAMIAVQRAFNWAAKAGLLKAIGGNSPLSGLEKPQQGRREQLVTSEEFEEILSWVKDRPFADLLETSWDTGARPHELFTVEARFVDLRNSRWVFPVKESKGKKTQRVVYLTEKALAITKRLMAEHPEGPLFRNGEGQPWCASSVKCRFQRLRDELGRRRITKLGLMPPKIKRLTYAERQEPGRREAHYQAVLERRRQIKALAKQYGTKYSLYAFRHAFCMSALESGQLDAVTVSVLMGHKDTTMISRHYSHLTQRLGHLRDAVTKARRGA
jgi:integrase